ncbi:ABC transporter ATP-binding protein [Halobacteriaceae archaeon GCM10025711]
MSAITVSGVAKRYGDLPVLSDLSFTVPEGAVFGLLGPNGAGKTTTINLLTGVAEPDAGHIDVLGRSPVDDPLGVRETVGVLPEKEAPPSFLTPREYFAFVAGVRELDRETVADRVTEWADRLGFADKLDTLNKDLSRGQQQKVMLVQAFLHDPDLVFIDEPLANLDPLVQDAVKEFIVAYHDAGNTVVLSTHHLAVADDLCTAVGILHDGRLARTYRPASEETLHDAFRAAVAEPAPGRPTR